MSDRFEELLRARASREDLDEAWPPDLNEEGAPLLLQDPQLVTALGVAAQVLEIISKRGGSKIRSSRLEALFSRAAASLPDHVHAHVREEAAQTLAWLERAEKRAPQTSEDMWRDPSARALEIMSEADVATRARVALLAIEEELDLELEYYDEARAQWFRLRTRPLDVGGLEAREDGGEDVEEDEVEVEVEEDDEEASSSEDASSSTRPHLRMIAGQVELEIPLAHIRWLMPVRSEPGETDLKPTAEVIRFPKWPPK